MTVCIISGSLNPESYSRVLCEILKIKLEQTHGIQSDWIDLQDYALPFCDGETAYAHPNVTLLKSRITSASLLIVGVPIYNFGINAAVKNLTELTGRAWMGKTVGFICAAGGKASYMSVMSFANSLMLDFRCVILPRFVYATGSDFNDPSSHPPIQLINPAIHERLDQLGEEMVRFLKLPLPQQSTSG